MTREETVKILTILKTAYPNFYKGMSNTEGRAVVSLWAMQFDYIPYQVMEIAINKLISTNTFPPAIAEVKDKLKSMYFEATAELLSNDVKQEQIGLLTQIAKCCRSVNTEPPLSALIDNGANREALPNETHD